MQVMVSSTLDGKDFPWFLELPDWEDIESMADQVGLPYDQMLERQVYLNFSRLGMRGRLSVQVIRTIDQELFEFLINTGNYNTYEGELHEI